MQFPILNYRIKLTFFPVRSCAAVFCRSSSNLRNSKIFSHASEDMNNSALQCFDQLTNLHLDIKEKWKIIKTHVPIEHSDLISLFSLLLKCTEEIIITQLPIVDKLFTNTQARATDLQEQLELEKQQNEGLGDLPELLLVSGRVGFNSAMNGLYKKGENFQWDMPYYTNEDTGWAIRFWEDRWLFDWRGLNDDEHGAVTASDDVRHPGLVRKVWRVYDGGNWTPDPNIQIKIVHTPKAAEKKQSPFSNWWRRKPVSPTASDSSNQPLTRTRSPTWERFNLWGSRRNSDPKEPSSPTSDPMSEERIDQNAGAEECKKEPSSPPMISEKTNTTPEDAEQLEREMIQELARLSVLPMKLDSREEEQAIAESVEEQLRKDFEANRKERIETLAIETIQDSFTDQTDSDAEQSFSAPNGRTSISIAESIDDELSDKPPLFNRPSLYREDEDAQWSPRSEESLKNEMIHEMARMCAQGLDCDDQEKEEHTKMFEETFRQQHVFSSKDEPPPQKAEETGI